jgi:hypothetical protein
VKTSENRRDFSQIDQKTAPFFTKSHRRRLRFFLQPEREYAAPRKASASSAFGSNASFKLTWGISGQAPV